MANWEGYHYRSV